MPVKNTGGRRSSKRSGNFVAPGGSSYTNNKPLQNVEVMSLSAKKNVSGDTISGKLIQSENFHYKQYKGFDFSESIGGGNPSDSAPNGKNGEITELSISGVNGNAKVVCLDFSIVGEWNGLEYNKGVIIAKYHADTIDGVYTVKEILTGAQQENSNGVEFGARFIQNFNVSIGQTDNFDSTMESCNGKYIDTEIFSGKFYKYTIVCCNSSSSSATFYLNRTRRQSETQQHESGVSVITAQVFY